MAARGNRRLNLQEAVESIFSDNDSDNENFDCGSDFEAIPDSDDDLQTEDSDLDESITAPQECIYRPLAELETASTNSEGITSLQFCAQKNSFL